MTKTNKQVSSVIQRILECIVALRANCQQPNANDRYGKEYSGCQKIAFPSRT